MFLPAMHDRYGFPVEIMLVLYALIFKDLYLEAAASIAVAILSYVPFLLDYTPVPLVYVAVFNIAMYFIVSFKIWKGTISLRADAKMK